MTLIGKLSFPYPHNMIVAIPKQKNLQIFKIAKLGLRRKEGEISLFFSPNDFVIKT